MKTHLLSVAISAYTNVEITILNSNLWLSVCKLFGLCKPGGSKRGFKRSNVVVSLCRCKCKNTHKAESNKEASERHIVKSG